MARQGKTGVGERGEIGGAHAARNLAERPGFGNKPPDSRSAFLLLRKTQRTSLRLEGRTRSFLLLFYKKEALPCPTLPDALHPRRRHPWRPAFGV
jgi:hypothetical protein